MIIDYTTAAINQVPAQWHLPVWNWSCADPGDSDKNTAYSSVVVLLDRNDIVEVNVRNLAGACVLTGKESYLMIRKG